MTRSENPLRRLRAFLAAEKHAFIKIGLPTVRRNSVEKP